MIFLALIYVAFISLGLPDSLLGSAWPFIHTELAVPVSYGGYISMVIALGTIISSLLAHLLVRRLGVGKVTFVSVAMTAVALLGFSFAPAYPFLILFAIPLGLGAGAVDSGLNEFVAEHYAAKHMNWLHCFWGLGALLGPALLSLLTSKGWSWRSSYFSIACIQFALVGLLAFSLPMWKKYDNSRLQHSKSPQGVRFNELFAPFKAKGAFFALFAFFLYVTIEGSIMLWGASYLVATKAAPPELAAGAISLFFMGLTAGRMLSGFVSTKLSNETLIKVGTLLVITGLALLMLPQSLPLTICLLIIVGMGLAPIFPSLLHQTPIYFANHNPGAAMGLQMAFAYTATTLMPPLLGQFFSSVSFTLLPPILFTCSLGIFICITRLKIINQKS